MINKEKAVYIGIGVFFLLVLLNSSKKVQLKEVTEGSANKLNFDNSKLPFALKPPTKWDENKPLPLVSPKKFNNNVNNLSLDGLMPRFDL